MHAKLLHLLAGSMLVIQVTLSASMALAATPLVSGDPTTVTVRWDDVVKVSATIPTTQHLANALTLRSSPLNKQLLRTLANLHTNATRLQLWFSVPNQVLAEIKEPTATQTFWDFEYMDSVVSDFFAHTSGTHHVNIGTIPRWMFSVPPVELPPDPAASFYPYTRGTTGGNLKDPTGEQFADYQARLFQWYTQGGFTDELGNYHKSDYHYKIDYWGILNESTLENRLSVEQYTRIYDAVVEAIRQIDSQVAFFGPEVVGPRNITAWERYFLDPKNHRPGALPVQWFSCHNYPASGNDPARWQSDFFLRGNPSAAQAFADQLREVVQIRDGLSPGTKIAVDELGTFLMLDGDVQTSKPYSAYNRLYWVASGANWAVNFITAQNYGIQLISMTQLVGAPTQSESCSMINWETGEPNAHYWTLQLVNSHFAPGDKLVATETSTQDITAQASIAPTGHKVLLVNTSNRSVAVNLGDAFEDTALSAEVVDETSGDRPPRKEPVLRRTIDLAPFAIAVVTTN